jgi:hypothetical protein
LRSPGTAAGKRRLLERKGCQSSLSVQVENTPNAKNSVLFGETGTAMDRMRTLAVAVPELSAPWLMVMISHTELMHNLWRVSKGAALDVAAEVEGHLAGVSALAARSRRFLAQGRPVLH